MAAPKCVPYKDADQIEYTNSTGSTISGGTPIQIGGRVAIAVGDIANGDSGSLLIEGRIKGEATADTGSVGDRVYWDADGDPYGGTAGTGAMTTDLSAGDFCAGILTAAKAGTDSHCKFAVNQLPANEFLDHVWVAPYGDDTYGDGSQRAPLATVTAAFAAVSATRKNVFVLPGTYAEAASLTWPLIDGVSLVGIGSQGSVVIQGATGEDEVIEIAPGALTSTRDCAIENLCIKQASDDCNGIHINNASTTKKIIVSLKNVSVDDGGGTGTAVATTHTDADNAIRIYWSGCGEEIESQVSFTVANNGDRAYFNNVYLAGGFVSSATDIATDFRFDFCKIKHEGVTGGHSSQLIRAVYCYSDEEALLNTDDLAGSHTETLMVPTS